MSLKDIPMVKTGDSKVDGDLERWRALIQQLAGFRKESTRAITTDDLKAGTELERFIMEVVRRTV